MEIEQLKMICDMVGTLGDKALVAVAWYIASTLVPPILVFTAFAIAITKVARLVRDINCPAPDEEELKRRREIHEAKLKWITSKGTLNVASLDPKRFASLVREKFVLPGVTSIERAVTLAVEEMEKEATNAR